MHATNVRTQLQARKSVDGVLLCCAKQKSSCWTPHEAECPGAFLSQLHKTLWRDKAWLKYHPLGLSGLLCALQNWGVIMFPPRSSFHGDERTSLLTMTNTPAGSRTLRSQRWAVVCLAHLLVIPFYGSMFLGEIIWTEICFMSLKVTFFFCWIKRLATKYCQVIWGGKELPLTSAMFVRFGGQI